MVDGLLAWKGKSRDTDKSVITSMALETRNGGTEWATNAWDTTKKEWKFFSSHNTCKIEAMGSCA